jgi:hypothetical protein
MESGISGATRIREPDCTMQMRDSTTLPLSDPMHTNHAHATKANFELAPELVPVIRGGRTVPEGEGQGESKAGKLVIEDGVEEPGIGPD